MILNNTKKRVSIASVFFHHKPLILSKEDTNENLYICFFILANLFT